MIKFSKKNKIDKVNREARQGESRSERVSPGGEVVLGRKKQQGFTLIETVLYLAIVGILFVAVINFHLILGGSATKLSSNLDTSRNRRIGLTAIEYLIRNADGTLKDVYGECSNFSVPSLDLYFSDDTYLPGDCVENGGAVKISLNDRRIIMTCYPNITYNGQYDACNTVSSEEYYLTTSDVVVTADDLRFSTSSDSGSSNGFKSVTTYLKTSIVSNDQVDLKASSSATSTIVLRNEQADGLVSWWSFEDGVSTNAVDNTGRNNMICNGTTQVAGLVSSSVQAYDFNRGETDRCTAGNPDSLNFNGAFTFAAWIKTDFASVSTQNNIINKGNWGTQEGYVWTIYSHSADPTARMWLRVFDSDSYTNTADTSSYVLSDGTTYHVTHVYDPDNDQAILYVYEKGVGMVNTTTVSGVPILVNYDSDFDVSDLFDGVIDELRVYNRALSVEEIYALQTQGAN